VLRFFADVMTGVPSIIMGLFIYTFWVVRFGVNGVTGFAGALASPASCSRSSSARPRRC
jgi:phosphate transport system permease protein